MIRLTEKIYKIAVGSKDADPSRVISDSIILRGAFVSAFKLTLEKRLVYL